MDLGDRLGLGAAVAVHEVDELVLGSALDPDSGGVVSAPLNPLSAPHHICNTT